MEIAKARNWQTRQTSWQIIVTIWDNKCHHKWSNCHLNHQVPQVRMTTDRIKKPLAITKMKAISESTEAITHKYVPISMTFLRPTFFFPSPMQSFLPLKWQAVAVIGF